MENENFSIEGISIAGLEGRTSDEIDKVISFLTEYKENSFLSNAERRKYVFRSNLIVQLAEYLMDNKATLSDPEYSEREDRELSLAIIVEEMPSEYIRYKYLLNDNNFYRILHYLNKEIIKCIPPENIVQPQDCKSRATLLKLQRKV